MKNSLLVRLLPIACAGMVLLAVVGCDDDDIESGSGLVYAIGDVVIGILGAIAHYF